MASLCRSSNLLAELQSRICWPAIKFLAEMVQNLVLASKKCRESKPKTQTIVCFGPQRHGNEGLHHSCMLFQFDIHIRPLLPHVPALSKKGVVDGWVSGGGLGLKGMMITYPFLVLKKGTDP